MRHMVVCRDNGMERPPTSFAELGPGDSLGISLAGLVGGAECCKALDIVPYAASERNLEIFDELNELFRNREAIPGADEFPGLHPRIDSNDFPRDLYTDEVLERALDPERLAGIRHALEHLGEAKDADQPIEYVCLWSDPAVISPGSVELVISQAVLEHVDEYVDAYRIMERWLTPGGWASHQIDFGCHGMADEWNGHWSFSDLEWKIVRGRRSYLLNRTQMSDHVRRSTEAGFEVCRVLPVPGEGGLGRDRLAKHFRNMDDRDLTTRCAHMVNRKSAPAT